MLPLFDPPPQFDRARLRDALQRLSDENVWIGTSSWKYAGWLDQIYTRERYLARGRFSEKRFEAECLKEYGETFPIVCGDFSFYQFPSESYWQRLFAGASPQLRFAFKVPEEITAKVFPAHARYGPRAGVVNESYLNAELFQRSFLDLLKPFLSQVPVLILEFGATSRRAADFLKDLDPFLSRLPADFRYAVEIRNREFLIPDYFDCLREHGVAHVFNSWNKMPAIGDQMTIGNAFTADFTVTRALLRPGRVYEEAVGMFSPYQKVQDEYPEGREALRRLIRRMREERRRAYIFVNNRLEGNAPQTIEAIVES